MGLSTHTSPSEVIDSEHVYEVGVFVSDGPEDYTYEVDHRFPQLPGTDTIVGLKDEARDAFAALYPDEEITQTYVRVSYLNADERGESEPVEVPS